MSSKVCFVSMLLLAAQALAVTLPQCDEAFPDGDPPKGDSTVNFETSKNSPWFKKAVASLAPCQILPDRCSDSYGWNEHLSGAVGSVTEIIHQNNPELAAFLAAIPANEGLAHTILDHTSCIGGQEGGVQKFLADYTKYVTAWVTPAKKEPAPPAKPAESKPPAAAKPPATQEKPPATQEKPTTAAKPTAGKPNLRG